MTVLNHRKNAKAASAGPSPKMLHWYVEVTVENSYPILGGNKGHSLVVDDVNASCFVGVTSLIEIIGQTC